MPTTETHRPIDFPCPTCAQPPGRPCQAGYVHRAPHVARVRKAENLNGKASIGRLQGTAFAAMLDVKQALLAGAVIHPPGQGLEQGSLTILERSEDAAGVVLEKVILDAERRGAQRERRRQQAGRARR